MLEHRAKVDLNQFRVPAAQSKREPIRRHRTDVVVGFAGSVDHNERRVVVNKSIWCDLLRFVGHDADKMFFDRTDARLTAMALERGCPPQFSGDDEAKAKMQELLLMFRQGRPMSVLGERFA